MAKTKEKTKPVKKAVKELKRGVDKEPLKFKLADLVKLCEDKIVNISKWKDEYFVDHQMMLFGLIGILKSGAEFETHELKTDFDYLVVTVWFPNFMSFNNGYDIKKRDTLYKKEFFIRK